MTLSTQIYSLLSGSTSVTGQVSTRIYPVTVPQDVRLPAVRYSIISNVREHAMTQDTGDVTARVQITSWGRTPDEAETVSEVVRGAVQRVISGGLECFLDNEFVDYDSDTERYAHSLDVIVHYTE
jgi:hypothetical protein